MISIDKVQFDFLMEDEYFARSLYGRWDDFCRFAFEAVIEDVFSPLDRNDAEILLEHIDLDLGKLPQENFDEEFAYALRLKLEEWRDEIQKKPYSSGITCTHIAERREDTYLFFYLVHGWLPKGKNREPQTPLDLVKIVCRSYPAKFRSFLQQEACADSIQKRMIFQWPDEILESVAGITVPEEKTFLSAYTRCLIQEYPRLPRKEMPQKEHRQAVWIIVFSYLFSRSRGHYSRRELVRQTLHALSARHAIKEQDLLVLLHDTALNRLPPGMEQNEFLQILAEINRDSFSPGGFPSLTRKARSIILPPVLQEKWQTAFPDSERQPGTGIEGKQEWMEPLRLRRWLSQLAEEETEQWTELLLPEESPFLISYARRLQKDKERNMFEGKAGSDFRFVKWEFIIQVSLSFSRDKKKVVLEVLLRLGAHYGLDTAQLLEYFFRHLQEEREDSLRELADIVARLRQDFNESPLTQKRRKESHADKEYLSRLLKISLETGTLPENTNQAADSLRAWYKKYPEEIREFLSQWKNSPFSLQSVLTSANHEWFSVILHILSDTPGLTDTNSHLTALEKTLIQAGIPDSRSSLEEKDLPLLLDLLTLYREKEIEVWLQSKKEGIGQLLFRPAPASRKALKKLVENTLIVDGLDDFLLSLWTGGELVTAFHETGIDFGPLNRFPEKILLSLLQEKEKSRMIPALSRWLHVFPHNITSLNRIPDRDKKRFFSLVVRDKELLSLTLKRYGASSLKTVLEQFALLNKNFPFIENEEEVQRSFLLEMENSLVRLSAEEWTEKLHLLLKQRIKPEDWDRYCRAVSGKTAQQASPGTAAKESAGDRQTKGLETNTHFLDKTDDHINHGSVFSEDPTEAPILPGILYPFSKKLNKEHPLPSSLPIENAGLVLFNPYLPLLFHRSKLLQEDRKNFKDDAGKVTALFLLQTLLYDDANREFEEYELALNRILVGCPFPEPLPRHVDLSPEETSFTSSLLSAVLSSWDKMKHTSRQAFQKSFLQRKGTLSETENAWILNIEPRSYDILLDSLPWGYSMIKYPWMNKVLTVHWQ